MRLHCAGGRDQIHINTVAQAGLHQLLSFLTEVRFIENFFRDYPNRRLLVDSGAYSWNKMLTRGGGVKVLSPTLPDIKEYNAKYLQWIADNAHRDAVFVELDCYHILGQKYLDDAAKEVRKTKGVRYMRTYHTWCDGSDLSVLRKWVNDDGETYIGVARDSLPIMGNIFNVTRDKIKLHGFAMTAVKLLRQYPFYSADSSILVSAPKYGKLVQEDFNGRNAGHLKSKLDYEGHLGAHDRMVASSKNFKRMETYITELWEARGITWKD